MKDAAKTAELLDKCVGLIIAGSSVKECMKRYPEAAELGSLIAIAERVAATTCDLSFQTSSNLKKIILAELKKQS